MNKLAEIIKSKKFIFLLTFCLIALIVLNLNIGFAKYISSTNGKATVDVAKFSFVVKEGEKALSKDFSYDIAAHITGGTNLSKDGICPGKSGEIDIIIDMSGSEVATGYAIYLDPKSTLPDNLKFYSDAGMTTEVNLASSSAAAGVINLANINTPIHPKIYWKWVWDEETNENEYELKNFIIDVNVTAWQYVGV